MSKADLIRLEMLEIFQLKLLFSSKIELIKYFGPNFYILFYHLD